MIKLLELLTSLYWLALPQTAVESFVYTEWRRAHRRGGVVGVAWEAVRALLGTNSWPFFVPVDSDWSGADIECLLGRYGIAMWGVGFAHGELFFRVQESKAAWAQYIMLAQGVPLQHGLYAGTASPRPRRRDAAKTAQDGKWPGRNEWRRRIDEWADRVDAKLRF